MAIPVNLAMDAPTQDLCSVRLPKIKLWMVDIGGQCPNASVSSVVISFPFPGVDSSTRVNLCQSCMLKVMSVYQRWAASQAAKKRGDDEPE